MSINFNTLGSADGVSNNTTAVTVGAAPGSSVFRSFRTLSVYNKDTANATLTMRLNDSSTIRIISKVTLTPGQTFQYGDQQEFIILDSTSKSVEIILAGAITTNQLDWVASWADYA